MDNSINVLLEQVDCQAVSQTCRTSMEELKDYSTRDLLDAWGKVDYDYAFTS